MCIPDFIKFEEISEDNPVVGYRNWINSNKELSLRSVSQNYAWSKREGPHRVRKINSGLYSYNDCNYHYYNNYYYNYYYHYYNNYNLRGIIFQWGKVAFHKTGYRSEFAKIQKLFTIRLSDVRGDKKLLDWIVLFNKHIEEIAQVYECETIHWQDFIESNEK